MLDPKGIYLAEINNRYPRAFQTLGYDVLLDTDEMNKPKVIPTFQLCVNAIITLLKMKPGQFPSIPDLGIDVAQYLHDYTDKQSVPLTIKQKLYDQLNRLNIVGIDIQVYTDVTEDGHDALIVYVEGDERMEYNIEMPPVVIGITYDQLGRMYTRIKYSQE